MGLYDKIQNMNSTIVIILSLIFNFILVYILSGQFSDDSLRSIEAIGFLCIQIPVFLLFVNIIFYFISKNLKKNILFLDSLKFLFLSMILLVFILLLFLFLDDYYDLGGLLFVFLLFFIYIPSSIIFFIFLFKKMLN